MIAPATCPWWRRWYHKRQRNYDRRFMWVSLSDRATGDRLARAWGYFISQPGQGHWRCACGAKQTPRELEL